MEERMSLKREKASFFAQGVAFWSLFTSAYSVFLLDSFFWAD